MTDEKYRQLVLEQVHPKETWENRPAPDWSIDDLDVPEIQRTVSEAVRLGRMPETASIEPGEALRGLRLSEGGVLLRAATVLFGKADRLLPEMPQCCLRVARFRDNSLTDPSDNRQLRGNVFTLLEGAARFLRDFVPVASKIENDRLVRADTPRYPFTAVREAVVNALPGCRTWRICRRPVAGFGGDFTNSTRNPRKTCRFCEITAGFRSDFAERPAESPKSDSLPCHRDCAAYGGSIGIAIHDDRLEVTSTGPFHFGLTPDKLLATPESRPWNPLIAGVLFRRGIIEQRGTGMARMTEEIVSAGLPPPETSTSMGMSRCASGRSPSTCTPRTRPVGARRSSACRNGLHRSCHSGKSAPSWGCPPTTPSCATTFASSKTRE